ncbi:DNA-LIGASE-A3 domain-containing protein [Mycena indigotica]|uniref:DNA-LIGASE-A3 domain-containing protein n=1 Tax=Mycena indigotica TaxID=2126181 RepID=A0A8H6WCE9_9AGAR|nr:DNA-LIGASE-A3 domain-containing protein [Mycena indigotica]KAF7309678.1 DNA-LIGASE-A3 domain-containing protein [Mycena indigotica]
MTSPPFAFFVSLLREIRGHNNSVLRVFNRWVTRLRTDFPDLAEGSTVTLFRFLFPEEDSRRKYDMKEVRLASAIADCFGISAKTLEGWTTSEHGCLGMQVENVLQLTSSFDSAYISSLSMSEVDDLLDELAANSGFTDSALRTKYPPSNRRDRSTIIRLLYRSLPPSEAGWLTQMILKDLRPMLYPLQETHYSRALKTHNSVSVVELACKDAMKVWDPSLHMLHGYRLRSRLEDAARAFERGEPISWNPQCGEPVPIPKARKGRGCDDALAPLRSSTEIWAETKYDGERAQIHVQLSNEDKPRITIFSKSLRDSTWDRYGIHELILESLYLAPNYKSSSITSDVIVEAEMVAWHGDKMDEFWRIHSLVEHTARSVRHAPLGESEEGYTQASLRTDISDRHLGLVFFDILLLNGTSLLNMAYSSRRSILESIIQPLPTRSMLTTRVKIALEGHPPEGFATIENTLATHIASGEEGLVLKAAESRYNDWRLPWVKFKKDYIPGYGDTIDCVLLGLGWDKDRARELRVSTDCYTTFYFGGLRNEADIKKDPTIHPHFYLFFTASYGLSRDDLEESNFYLRAVETVPWSSATKQPAGLPFTFTMLKDLTPPSHILVTPLLCELFGAGFTKAPHSRSYALRHPRIVKLFRPHERTWSDGVTLSALHKIAQESMGRDRSDKDVDDWVNTTWNKPVSPTAAVKRKATIEKWEQKLVSDRSFKVPHTRSMVSLQPELAMPSESRIVVGSSQQTATKETTDIQLKPGSSNGDLPILLQNAAVFLATQNKKLRHHWQGILPASNTVHCLESLFEACGWLTDDHSQSNPSIKRGIVLLSVDETREDLVREIHDRKLLCAGPASLKSIWVLAG